MESALEPLSSHILLVHTSTYCRVVGIIADGHRVNCTHLIMSSEYVPAEVKSQGEEKWIDRAVYITNKSIWTEEKEHVCDGGCWSLELLLQRVRTIVQILGL